MTAPMTTPVAARWPRALPAGGAIGVCAPSSYVDASRLMDGKTILERAGYRVILHDQARGRLRETQNAGTVDEKLRAFHALLTDPAIDAVLFAGGGNFAIHAVDRLDFPLIARAQKPIMGFSDATLWLNAITRKSGLVTFHGPMLNWIGRNRANPDIDAALAMMSGSIQSLAWPEARLHPSTPATTADGVMLGGNLSMLQTLLGTGFAPDMAGRYILFFEDTGLELSHFDRMLHHLRHAGWFKRASALVFGRFDQMQDRGRPFGYRFDDIVADIVTTTQFKGPVILGAPFGHDERLVSLPVGALARLEGTTLRFMR